METTKIIFLWSHVRSVSTAFERTFMQRQDYITFHEPFGEPCYFGPERIYSYYDNDLSAHAQYTHLTFSQIIKEILTAASGNEKKNVFIKDMARHVVRPDYKSCKENLTVLPIDFLKRCQHTFILRTPKKAVPSLYRAYVETKQQFIHDDIGYPELEALFEFLTNLTGNRPVLIDADDLLKTPNLAMEMYCKAIEERFEPAMLEWKSARVPAFDKWAHWHDRAQYSTGFNKCDQSASNNEDLVLPDDVKQLIEKSMPIYDKMHNFRLLI